MDAVILGLATALPPGSIAQSEAAELALDDGYRSEEERRLLRVLYRRSGVRTRSSVSLETDASPHRRPAFFPLPADPTDMGPGTAARMRRYREEASGLAERAARAALEDAGLTPERVSQLVTVSCTGFYAPNFDVALIKRLGLPATTGRTHVGFMGCQGALNALRVASSLARAAPGANVLMCAVELCSLHFQYGFDPDQMVANALFSDGAAAAVVGPGDGTQAGWRVRASGAWLLPDSEDAMTWTIGDNGFVMTLSPQVPDLIARHLRPSLDPWLAQHGLALPDVATWAVHPGGPRVVSAVADVLGLDRQRTQASRDVLAECGNMSSPTILFILERLLRAGAPTPCVALAFGPGLTAEAALLG